MMKRYVLDERHEQRHCQKRRDRDPPAPYPDTTVHLNLTQKSKIFLVTIQTLYYVERLIYLTS